MGRRKKEEPSFHRDCIAKAAEQLFLEKGILATTMDDIANTAKYSKATLYVYFRDKDEIVGVMVVKSIRMLYERLKAVINNYGNTQTRYLMICKELTEYHEKFPLYFELAIGEINIDFDHENTSPIEQELFEIDELIMNELVGFIKQGIEEKVLRHDVPVLQTVFLFWASLSGIIVMAEKKQRYIQKTMGLSKQQFLDIGFDTLFRSICI